MAKTHDLDSCKTWNDFKNVAKENGMTHKRTSGGHDIWGNERGSMPFSTHEKEMNKGMRCQVKKELKLLLGLVIVVFLFVMWNSFSIV